MLRIYETTCAKFGLNDKAALHQLFLSCVGTNTQENDRRIHAALKDRVDVDRFLQDWNEQYRQHVSENAIPVKKGVTALLDALDERAIPAAVATSSRTAHAMQKLEQCNLIQRFKTITGGDQVEQSKPAPDIFLKAAQSISVAPECCLAFEDSFNGVHAAVAAGMQVFQVPDLLQPTEDLLALGHTVVESLGDVEKMVWG